MANIHRKLSKAILIVLFLVGSFDPVKAGVILNVSNAPTFPPLAEIDGQLWQEFSRSPSRQAEYWLGMHESPGEGPFSAIDLQIHFVKVLDILQEHGSIQLYNVYYGQNLIQITGSLGSLRFLADWPGVAWIAVVPPAGSINTLEGSFQPKTSSASGMFSGLVTAPDGTTPLEGIKVTAYRQINPTSWTVEATGTTDSSGNYSIGGLITGVYRASFEDLTGVYVTEYYNDKLTFGTATSFDVTDGQTTPNINASLALAGRISGVVTAVQGGAAVKDIVVSAWNFNGTSWVNLSSDVTASNGTYTIGSLPTGTYRVKYADVYFPPRYLTEWYNNKIDLNSADNISVTAGATTPDISASLGGYGWMAGNVKAFDGSTNLAGINVDVYQFDSGLNEWVWVSYTTSDSSGNYKADGLVTKNYRVMFNDPLNQFTGEYYNDKPDITTADDVPVILGEGTLNINAQLALKQDTVSNDLVTGWNLISLPVTLSNTAPASAFASLVHNLVPNYGDVFAYNACDFADPWKLFNPNVPPPVNDLTEVGVTNGYWINMTAPDTLALTGTHPVQTTVNLCAGWNLIGFPSMTKQAVATALASISGKYSLVYQYKASDLADPWKSYNPAAPPQLNDLQEMEDGYGYWIKMSQAATLIIAGR